MDVKESVSNYISTEKRGIAIETCIFLASQLCHYVAFELKSPSIMFESAMLIMSVDVDVGNPKLGLISQGRNDENVHKCFSEQCIGEVEERVLPIFVKMFNAFEIPVTFAIRGQLTELDDPLFQLLLDSPVRHDIGAHGYSHRSFHNLSRNEAEAELGLISVGLRKFGVVPRSFVFPRNNISHLDLLEKYEYECYREDSNFLRDGMFIEKRGRLYNVQPSLYLNYGMTPFILNRILDIAVAKKAPLHLWFHPWSFGFTPNLANRFIEDVFLPFLKRARNKERKRMLTFETMLSAARKANEISVAIE